MRKNAASEYWHPPKPSPQLSPQKESLYREIMPLWTGGRLIIVLGKIEKFLIELARLRQVLHIDRHVCDTGDLGRGSANSKEAASQAVRSSRVIAVSERQLGAQLK